MGSFILGGDDKKRYKTKNGYEFWIQDLERKWKYENINDPSDNRYEKALLNSRNSMMFQITKGKFTYEDLLEIVTHKNQSLCFHGINVFERSFYEIISKLSFNNNKNYDFCCDIFNNNVIEAIYQNHEWGDFRSFSKRVFIYTIVSKCKNSNYNHREKNLNLVKDLYDLYFNEKLTLKDYKSGLKFTNDEKRIHFDSADNYQDIESDDNSKLPFDK